MNISEAYEALKKGKFIKGKIDEEKHFFVLVKETPFLSSYIAEIDVHELTSVDADEITWECVPWSQVDNFCIEALDGDFVEISEKELFEELAFITKE